MRDGLESLLKPSSVALIGASANPSKLSNVALRNLKRGRFKVYPINPKESKILGMKCYPSINEVPGRVDLAIVSLPAVAASEALSECIEKQVNVVIVTASGFRESGSEGAARERELERLIQNGKTRVLGPNTMGVYSPVSGLDTLFIPRERSPRPPLGNIAMLSQSGAVSISFLEKVAASGLGISHCIGLGNKMDISENELIRLLAADSSTNCIALYLESFSDGREFFEIARNITPHKPMVVLKSGRTESGAAAASSHTGAMAASSDVLVERALHQAGVLRAYDEEELVDIAKALSFHDHINGDRICVVASAGGYGVIASDLVESKEHGAGLRMASLSGTTQNRLRKVMPDFSSPRNPVDLTASVTDDMYDSVLEILQGDSGIDGVMMSLELQPPNVTRQLLRVAERRSSSDGAKIVISAFGGRRTDDIIRDFSEKRIPAYPTIWRAIRALGALAQRGLHLKTRK